MTKKSKALSEAMKMEREALEALSLVGDKDVVREVYVVKYALSSGPFRRVMDVFASRSTYKDGQPACYARDARGGLFVRMGSEAFLTEAAAREAMVSMYERKVASLRKQLEQLQAKATKVATVAFPSQG